MVFLNQTTMQMTAKIVYYGPGLCGKTTNLQWIHAKTAPRSRGEMVSLETETDRTLFFDLLPLDVGVIGGMKVRLQLYTVPGQVFYNATRRLVLKGVDGVVFVADSQTAALEANLESLSNLKANLSELGLSLDRIPIVFQYNKRDIRSILPVEQLREALNPGGAPAFEAAALHGVGVFETLKAISRAGLGSIRTRVAANDPGAEPVAPHAISGAPPGQQATHPAAPPSPTRRPDARPATKAGAPRELADLVPDPPPPADVKVEFPEEATDKHGVRPVPTLNTIDIAGELEKLRATAVPKKMKATSFLAPDVDRLFQGLLSSDKGARQEVKRKVAVGVPGSVLRGAARVRVHLAFEREGREELVEDVVEVKLVGDTKRLERLALKLDIDLKGNE